jgi:hypothetical protein
MVLLIFWVILARTRKQRIVRKENGKSEIGYREREEELKVWSLMRRRTTMMWAAGMVLKDLRAMTRKTPSQMRTLKVPKKDSKILMGLMKIWEVMVNRWRNPSRSGFEKTLTLHHPPKRLLLRSTFLHP